MKRNNYKCYQNDGLRKALSVVLIFAQTHSVLGAIPSPTGRNHSVFIQRIGRLNSSSQELYPILEKQIQRWLENMDNLEVSTISLAPSLKGDTLEMELISLELKQMIEDLKKKLFTGADLDGVKSLVQKMIDRRKLLSGITSFGPVIQKSIIFEAAYYWKVSKKEKTRELLHRAMLIHPKGEITDLADWESSTISEFNWVGFDLMVAHEKKMIKRGCSLQVEVQPRNSKLSVNGFQINNVTIVSLPIGAIHHLSAQADGFGSGEELIRCQTPGKRMVKIQLEKKLEANPKLSQNSTLLVKVLQDEFKLYLYTPKRAFDEIPLEKPIRVAELSEDSNDNLISVPQDAVLDIFRRHNIATLDNRELGRIDSEAKGVTPMTLDARVKGSSGEGAWFKSPVFWGIMGGLLAGGAITYFATRSSGEVNTSEMDPGAMARK